MASNSKNGILMILSPAKTLDLSPLDACITTTTSPDCDVAKTMEVMEAMKKRKGGELGKLLGISANLTKTAHEYWSNMEVDPTNRADASDVKPCIHSFSGTAYNGLEASSLDSDSMAYLQNNLRIIDPLYGVLRPLDMMQPYRLEMATRNVFPNNKSLKLATYWQPSVTKRLSEELMLDRNEMILLNLASDVYSAAVDEASLPKSAQFVRVVFRQEGRVIAVHAKRARGLMTRYLAETRATSLEDVKSFDAEGYAFVANDSDETTLVFDRKKPAAKKRAATSKPTTAKKQSSKKRR